MLDLGEITALESAHTCGCIVDTRDECCCDADPRVVAVCRELRESRAQNERLLDLNFGFMEQNRKLREENARLTTQRDVFDEQASGLFNGRVRGMAEKKALAKRVEELEEIFYRVSVESVTGMPMVYDMAREIAERRAGRA